MPFGRVNLTDPRYNPARQHRIHNHFLIKELDAIKEGGILAVITSAFTLDSLNPAARRVGRLWRPDRRHPAAQRRSPARRRH
ncbi:hypothetical protein ACFQX6_67075 [Streptosporangium lutulentum]